MKIVDLRSDTVTKPSLEMRQTIMEAEVGDDVYGEDPTINKLEEMSAELMGKEAALFVPTGTMANQIAVLVHTERGEEIILEERSHIYNYEVGGIALLAGVLPTLIAGEKAKIMPEQLKRAIKAPDIHAPKQTLLCLENTHNMAGGLVSTANEISELAQIATENGLKVHLDGARIFNAAAYLNTSPQEIVKDVDSMMFCLSKGLGAPVGSMLVGSREFITGAKRYRKMLGGGMRQAGILAAAGIYALENNRKRLAEDHNNAKILAEGINKLNGLKIDLETLHTNIVMIDITKPELGADELVTELEKNGVLTGSITDKRIRLVTHLDITTEDINYTLEVFNNIMN
ncbi:L-threonine aldolase [Desulfonispora thiosulfatigenes DSM 11270]|uniref:L-threonine aldolase n=1 Tax=Desulfonispora thiosulfatigenes DSM 11270 TaxID=656914 RepID=A0A1W1UK81_DESTI|nr:low-specificity L-threonine aldolase [Desulfonispora thiosulfatigenes]SMB81452.1 L-threonine aldolase [Desulfonispora thiosulfatigenes DSM 11270]